MSYLGTLASQQGLTYMGRAWLCPIQRWMHSMRELNLAALVQCPPCMLNELNWWLDHLKVMTGILPMFPISSPTCLNNKLSCDGMFNFTFWPLPLIVSTLRKVEDMDCMIIILRALAWPNRARFLRLYPLLMVEPLKLPDRLSFLGHLWQQMEQVLPMTQRYQWWWTSHSTSERIRRLDMVR